MFTLTISFLTSSNLPWFMDLIFPVLMPYGSLQHRTCFPSPVTSTTGHCFALGLSLHSFWSYFSTIFWYHIGHLPTWGVHLLVSYLFAFSYCWWGSQGENAEVVFHSLLQLTMFCQNSPPWPLHLGPYTVSLSFIELEKAVIHVISLFSFLFLWFSFCMPSDG